METLDSGTIQNKISAKASRLLELRPKKLKSSSRFSSQLCCRTSVCPTASSTLGSLEGLKSLIPCMFLKALKYPCMMAEGEGIYLTSQRTWHFLLLSALRILKGS